MIPIEDYVARAISQMMTGGRVRPWLQVDGPPEYADLIERYVNAQWNRYALTCFGPARYDLGGYE